MTSRANPAGIARNPIKRLDADHVPVLPPGVSYLFKTLNDDNLGFREIATAIEKLPSIAARILALANSAWSSPPRPLLALDQACGWLGLKVVRSTSIAIAIAQPFNPARCPAFDSKRFWQASLMNADAAHQVAELMRYEQQSVARTAGLLSALGLVWLAEALPQETTVALQLDAGTGGGTLDQALNATCGIGYVEAGAMLADAWQLPTPLRDAIAQQVAPAPDAEALARIVNAAIKLARRVRRCQELDAPEPGLLTLGIDDTMQRTVFDRLQQTRTQTAELAEVIFPA